MASITSKSSRFDQENSQFFRVKNVVQGRSFGPAKNFQTNNASSASLATPRRALGDVGNTLKTPGNLTKKSLQVKANHQSTLRSKTPGTKRITRATPHGKGLSKQIASSIQNKKQAFQVRGSLNEQKISTIDKDGFKKENMFPFTDEEKPLPRGPVIHTILKNVGELYRDCLQPLNNRTSSLDASILKMETVTRPETDSFCNWFGFDDFTDFSSNNTDLLETFELPPVDTNLSSLGLP